MDSEGVALFPRLSTHRWGRVQLSLRGDDSRVLVDGGLEPGDGVSTGSSLAGVARLSGRVEGRALAAVCSERQDEGARRVTRNAGGRDDA
jgi:hypothetical protein